MASKKFLTQTQFKDDEKIESKWRKRPSRPSFWTTTGEPQSQARCLRTLFFEDKSRRRQWWRWHKHTNARSSGPSLHNLVTRRDVSQDALPSRVRLPQMVLESAPTHDIDCTQLCSGSLDTNLLKVIQFPGHTTPARSVSLDRCGQLNSARLLIKSKTMEPTKHSHHSVCSKVTTTHWKELQLVFLRRQMGLPKRYNRSSLSWIRKVSDFY